MDSDHLKSLFTCAAEDVDAAVGFDKGESHSRSVAEILASDIPPTTLEMIEAAYSVCSPYMEENGELYRRMFMLFEYGKQYYAIRDQIRDSVQKIVGVVERIESEGSGGLAAA